MDIDSMIQGLLARLPDAIACSVERATLRSDDLRPDVAGTLYPWRGLSEERRVGLVESVCERRSHAVAAARSTRGVVPGRLLCYYPDLNLADGAAEAESGGFFDVNNTPPWNLWLGYVPSAAEEGGFIVSWVPRTWLTQAARGVRANPERCLWWIDELDTEMARALQKRVGTGVQPL